MAKQVGTLTLNESDAYSAPEMLEPEMRKTIKARLDAFAFASFAADREVFRQALPVLKYRDLEVLVIAGAEARARWLSRALALSQTKAPLTAPQVAELAHLRDSFEELSSAFEAIKRLVERGYTTLE
jgi:hypothetical protein